MTDQQSGEPAPAPLDPDDPYRFGRPDETPPAAEPPTYQHPAPVDGWVAYPPPPADDDRARRYGPSPYANVPPPPSVQPPPDPYQGPPDPYRPPPVAGGPGQPPYPPPPYSPGAPPAASTRTATAALVLGLVSIPFATFAYLDVVPVLLAVFFGLKVLNEQRPGRSNAIVGLVAAAVGAVLAIVVSVQLTSAVGRCGGWGNAQDAGFRQCVQNQL
ncbi:MAG: hypothetical protein ACTHMS_10435 [Jatrophihabitans sp.]|uniref:hypothetical protein n=1 Tax=Jatrophihabitans sp. TaxID=1932789 RepID=UPI003F7EDFF6